MPQLSAVTVLLVIARKTVLAMAMMLGLGDTTRGRSGNETFSIPAKLFFRVSAFGSVGLYVEVAAQPNRWGRLVASMGILTPAHPDLRPLSPEQGLVPPRRDQPLNPCPGGCPAPFQLPPLSPP